MLKRLGVITIAAVFAATIAAAQEKKAPEKPETKPDRAESKAAPEIIGQPINVGGDRPWLCAVKLLGKPSRFLFGQLQILGQVALPFGFLALLFGQFLRGFGVGALGGGDRGALGSRGLSRPHVPGARRPA